MSKVFYFIFVSLLLLSFGANLFADNLTDMPDKYLDKSIKELNRYNTSEGTESFILWDNRNVQSTSGLVAVELTGLPADSQLINPADDFVVPAGMQWTVDSIYAEGFNSLGSIDPDSFGVIIYDNNGGVPGNILYRETLIPSGTYPTNLEITLSTPQVLQTGTYWVSIFGVFVDSTGLTNSRWNWYMDNTAVSNEAVLQDLAGIFGFLPWTPITGLGLADPSMFFVIAGDDSVLSGVNDYAVNSIVAPGLMMASNSYDVTVEVENVGTLSAADVPVRLYEDGMEISSLTVSLAAGEDSLLTFSYTPASSGDFELCAISYLAVDTNAVNDTACVDVSVLPAGLSEIVFEDFESGVWPPAGWTEFHTGVDALDSTSAQALSPMYSAIFDDVTGVDTSWFVTPQIMDLGTNPLLIFNQYQVYGTWYEYHAIWVSTGNADPDSGDYVEAALLPAGAGPWELITTDLSAFVGEDIYIAFVYYGSYADEWYLDDITLFAELPIVTNDLNLTFEDATDIPNWSHWDEPNRWTTETWNDTAGVGGSGALELGDAGYSFLAKRAIVATPGSYFDISVDIKTQGWDQPGTYDLHLSVQGIADMDCVLINSENTFNTFTLSGMSTSDSGYIRIYGANTGGQNYVWVDNVVFDDEAPPPPDPNVIFEDDFEAYTAGVQLTVQNSVNWTPWSGTPGVNDPYVSTDYANSGVNSINIINDDDVVYVMPNYTTGAYKMSFDLYVPTGSEAYFNTLQEFTPTPTWGMQAYFRTGGVGDIDADGATSATFTYTYDTWLHNEVIVNLEKDTAEYYIDGVRIHGWKWSAGTFSASNLNQLGGNNFYGGFTGGTTFDFYVDDYELREISPAIFGDNFDSYTAGTQLVVQNSVDWRTWSGGSGTGEDPFISDAYSNSGPNSLLIDYNNDVVKLLGSQTSGAYSMSWQMYIPDGGAGYFNTMAGFDPNPNSWAMSVDFNVGGGANLNDVPGSPIAFTYAYDTWHQVEVIVDLDQDLAELYFNGMLIHQWQWTQGGSIPLRLDANDFWGQTASDEMYIDDYTFDTADPIVNGIDGKDGALPITFDLKQNYPNPFNPTTTIKYQLPKKADVKIVIYNVLGQVVHTVLDKSIDAGYHEIVWNGLNEVGNRVATGIYFYRMETDNFVKTHKMIMMK